MEGSPSLDPNEARVLATLLRTETAVSGRAVARVTGLSQSTAQRSLARLRAAGLVVAEPAPPSLLYRANHDHLAMPALLVLLRLDDELRARMARHVAGWRPQPASVVIYGSVARGTATPASDLDLLVVRPDATEPDEAGWQRQLADLADRVQRWTGRRASVVEMSSQEAVQGLADLEPFVVEANRDGWLVAGQALGELAGGRA
jgi:predicted nucleotidyltransferase